jgi:hypothetical protein
MKQLTSSVEKVVESLQGSNVVEISSNKLMLRKKNFNQKLIRIDESGKNLEKNKNKNDLY